MAKLSGTILAGESRPEGHLCSLRDEMRKAGGPTAAQDTESPCSSSARRLIPRDARLPQQECIGVGGLAILLGTS
jgi:hypothetical protein